MMAFLFGLYCNRLKLEETAAARSDLLVLRSNSSSHLFGGESKINCKGENEQGGKSNTHTHIRK